MNIRLRFAIHRQPDIWVVLDVVLLIQHRALSANKQNCLICAQFSHFVQRHQFASRLLEVGRTGAIAAFCLSTCAGGKRFLAQQLDNELQRRRLVAAAEK